ncbi:MAG: radical SAM protein [Candidatus Omnitrophota bacterium]|nr:radical SAM protein [Candidatus Omnitrophota bacterium]
MKNGQKLKTLLLEPLSPVKAAWGDVSSLQGHLPPMGVISIYSWLKSKKHDVDFIDMQFGDFVADSLKQYLKKRSYDVVGLSVYTPTADYAFETAKIVKEALPSSKVVMGNIHVTMLPELSMQQCPELDFIIRHEGEHAMDEFLSELSGGNEWSKIAGLVYREGEKIIINEQRPFVMDLDSLPLGFYSDLDLKRYVPHMTQYVVLPNYSVMTQRGCPYSCTYCGASKILGKKIRFYSPERIVEELKILKFEKKARGVYFQDSTFTINREFTMKLMKKMVEADLGLLWSCNTRADCVDPELLKMMYKAGGRQIAIGVESGNQETLDFVNKNITIDEQMRGVRWVREAGFRCLNNFIICLPNENEDMVRRTIRCAKKMKAPISVFWLPVPYPGTGLNESCKRTGGLRKVDKWHDYLSLNFDNPVYVNPNFGLDKMRYWHRRANLEYYLSPAIWWENIRTIRSVCDIRRLMQGGCVIFEMFYKGLVKVFKKIKQGNKNT